jgi:hypothetical protein
MLNNKSALRILPRKQERRAKDVTRGNGDLQSPTAASCSAKFYNNIPVDFQFIKSVQSHKESEPKRCQGRLRIPVRYDCRGGA